MKRTMRRITAMFLAVVMTMSLIGITPIFADAGDEVTSSASQNKNTYHDGDKVPANGGDSANIATASSDTNQNTDGSVTVSKTISATDVENQFKIDLNVVTTEDLESVDISPDAAVVLVIDSSGSMKDGVNGDGTGTAATASQRMTLAKAAAKDFVTSFVASATDGAKRYVSVVDFDSDAQTVQNWVDVAGGTSYQYVQTDSDWESSNKSAYNSGNKEALDQAPACDATSANTYEHVYYTRSGNSYYKYTITYTKTAVDGKTAVNTAIDDMVASGGTATAAGLYEAQSLLQSSAIAGIDYVYVVLLTDGEPTYDKNGSSNNNSSGTAQVEVTQAEEGADACEAQGAKVYTIAFAGENLSLSVSSSNNTYKSYPYTYVNDWLAQKVASNASYHSNATTDDSLTLAFDSITESITKFIQSWKVTDPMGDYITLLSSETEMGDNNTNSVKVASNGDFVWNLLNSTATQGGTNANKTYTYSMDYLVELDTKAAGFVDDVYYLTNGTTYLNYYFMETEGGVTTQSDVQTINFNVPAVQGKAPEYTLTVQHLDKATGESIYTDTDEDDDTNSGTYKRWTEYTTSDKDEELTNYTYVSAEAPTNASGTLTEDTTVTYYYTKNDDTFTENHYVQVISGWYYDSYNDLVQVVEGTDTVIKDNEGNVTYVLVYSDDTTDTIGESVTVTAESTEVNTTCYNYNDTLTTLDDVSDSTLTATIGEDYIMNLFYDFNTDPSFDFTVEHYVQVVNGVYYDGENWVSSDAEYVKVDTTSPDPSVTVGSTITTETYATNGGYYSTYSYDHSDPTPTMTVDASGMTLKLYYTLSGDNSAKYTVNHWVEINENGYYYNAAGVATYVANWTTDASGSVKVEDGTYYYGISINNTKSTTIGTLVSASALETGVDNYEYDSSISSASATVMSETGTELNLFYTLNVDNISYGVDYYLQYNEAGYFYVMSEGTATWYNVYDAGFSGETVTINDKNYAYYASESGIAPVQYGTKVEVSAYSNTLYASYDWSEIATLSDETTDIDSFNVITSGLTLNLYYNYSASQTQLSYNVEYYKLVGEDYVLQSGYNEKVSANYGAKVVMPQYYETKFENYTYETATFTGENMTVTVTGQTLKLYYDPAEVTYDVVYWVYDATTETYSSYNAGSLDEDAVVSYYGEEVELSLYDEEDIENYTLEEVTFNKVITTENYTSVKGDNTVTIENTDDTINLYYTPDEVTYTVEYYLQNNDGVTYGDPISYTEGATEGKYSTVYTATVPASTYEAAIQEIEGNYTLEDKTVLTGGDETDFVITEENMVLEIYLTPASMSYNVRYYLYDATAEEYVAQTQEDADKNISTNYDATIYASTYSDKEFENYTFNDEATDDSMLIEVTGQTLNLYYNPDAVTFNVEHYIAINEEGYISLNGTDYVLASAQENATIVDDSWYLVDESHPSVTLTSTETVATSDKVADVYSYDETLTTLTDSVETVASGLSVVIDETNMTIKLYYTAGESFDTSASYNVIHYVEVLNGFYYDNGVWVPTTDSGYHLMDADYAISSKLGATHYEIDEQSSFEGYAYVENGTSITIIKDGDNTLNLYYEASVSTTVDLTVTWVDEDGNNIADSFGQYFVDGFGTYYNAQTGVVGENTYAIGEKTISGYTFKEMGNDTALEGYLLGKTAIIYVYSKNSTGGNYVPSTPSTPTTTDDSDEPTTDIPDTDVPLTDIPDTDVPMTDIPDTDVPLTDIPEEDVPLVDIPMEDVPMSDIPQTGDDRNIGFMVATALVSAAGLAWLVKSELDEKKKHNN